MAGGLTEVGRGFVLTNGCDDRGTAGVPLKLCTSEHSSSTDIYDHLSFLPSVSGCSATRYSAELAH